MSDVKVDWPVERAEPGSVGLCPRRLERVAQVMQRYVDERRILGGITLVARRGRIAHLACTGAMTLQTRAPMRPDGLFRIYSMTKLVTSAAVLMLMEEGRFLLQQPAFLFLPELKDLQVAVTGEDGVERRVGLERPITIHHLLTHTSGFDYDYVHTAAGEGLTLEQYLPRQCQRPLRLQPGRQWLYGASTDILGRLVEVVSGMPLDAFFQERIFAPLGMTDTAFWVPPAKADRLVEMVTHDGAGGLAPGEPLHRGSIFEKPAFLSGGGGLVSTTSDYLRFSLMLLNGGALDGVRLLAPKTVELMRADHLPAGQPPLDHNRRGFGLGVSVLRRLGETQQVGSVGEFGWGGAACTQVWIDPAERMVTLMMSQLRPTGIVGIFPIMDLVKQAAYQAILD